MAMVNGQCVCARTGLFSQVASMRGKSVTAMVSPRRKYMSATCRSRRRSTSHLRRCSTSSTSTHSSSNAQSRFTRRICTGQEATCTVASHCLEPRAQGWRARVLYVLQARRWSASTQVACLPHMQTSAD